MVAVPVTAFCVILALPVIGGTLHLGWDRGGGVVQPGQRAALRAFLLVLLVAFFLSEASPNRMVALFSGVIIVMLLTGVARPVRPPSGPFFAWGCSAR